MNDAGRLLRYVIPGSLFLLVLGLWFTVEFLLLGHPRPVPDPPKETMPSVIAVIAASTLPIGFLISVLGGAMRWWRYQPFGWPDDAWLVAPESPTRPKLTVLAVADVTYRVDKRRGKTAFVAVSARLQSLLDLMNGLANAALAVLLGYASSFAYLGLMALAGRLPATCSLAAAAAAFSAAVLLVSCLLLFAQRRVARIVTEYERLILSESAEGTER